MERTSIFLSLILRHKPETIGISLDAHGWANVQAMIDGINRTGKYSIDMTMLEEIVRTDNKQRYSFNADRTMIRANQGHSVPVDVDLQICIPPEILYHGTGIKYVSLIREQGLNPRSRLYVHLSSDIETAVEVGARHGIPHVFKIRARAMHEQGFQFFLSENGVWLTKNVPAEYLEIL